MIVGVAFCFGAGGIGPIGTAIRLCAPMAMPHKIDIVIIAVAVRVLIEECDGHRPPLQTQKQCAKKSIVQPNAQRASPLGNMTFSGAALKAARSFGMRRLLVGPASRGGACKRTNGYT